MTNKQNSARSVIEPAAYASIVFKTVKRMQQEHTVSGLRPKYHPLKRIILNEFKDLTRNGYLCMTGNKKNLLIDFLCNFP